jgi:hypothetical protein
VVNTITMVCAMSKTFLRKFFLSPCDVKDLKRAISQNIVQQKQNRVYLQTAKDPTSGRVPHRIQLSYPFDYHPSTRLNLLRSSSAWRREHGRLDAIAAIGGRSLECDDWKREVEEDGCKKIRMWERESAGPIMSP